MASIKIYDLNSAGSDLFRDSESYMNELGDGELSAINGGRWSGWRCVVAISLISAISVGATATGTPTVTVVTAV
ncbi:MAG: hypothetical protein HWQ35_03030 [Nostoc sp. NMS1]|uniref:hypothetical protein n=1 Tax=unclassified Nostoc TaxID=2593658 RepID=UPI0025CD2C64|nr:MULTISPECIES: hypothetical protein [unclassified Nostoc]MBN3905577.1 hypothetical protein [Nostoc sp. NMS1]MBN3992461.1 hypothetical protein [Nostoc sp. NMS2]